MQFDPDFTDTIKKYFTFSRREYKASLALLLITLAIWFFGDIQNYFFPPKFDTALMNAKVAEFEAFQAKNEAEDSLPIEHSQNNTAYGREALVAPEYFSFNPNSATEEELQRLGLSKKQIHTIKNYLAKVGEIKSKADFKKIYGISETQFNSLEAYILLPETNVLSSAKAGQKKSDYIVKLSIELNSADSTALDKLPGIGMGYARRIIKYRTALGGFVKLSQLLEAYGFRETLLDSISPFLILDVSKILRLNINTASAERLKVHPYIRYKIANAIVNYRMQHGNFKSIDELKNIVLITDEIFTKINSYVTVD